MSIYFIIFLFLFRYYIKIVFFFFSSAFDSVGFHIEDYCLNFIDCCCRRLGCRVDRNNMLVELAGRTVQVKAFPIGIPFERFVKLAETAPKFLNDTEKVKVIIGVDRLDYTKGK